MIREAVVFVVDDDSGVRSSLTWLLESLRLPVRAYDSARGFLAACDPGQPGCLVLDVRMPVMDGLELQESLAARGIDIPLIIVTGHGDVSMAVRALKAGAVDFLEKPLNHQVLLERINYALRLDAQRRAVRVSGQAVRDQLASLSPRQHEVLARVLAGKSNKEIAKEFGVSPNTVELHRAAMMKKMGAKSVVMLAQMCAQVGLDRESPQ